MQGKGCIGRRGVAASSPGERCEGPVLVSSRKNGEEGVYLSRLW